MRHVGLKTERLRPADGLQQFDHALPAVHAAPADLAFRRQPLAVGFGDVAGLAERLRDQLRVGGRVLRVLMDAGRRIDANDAVRPHAEIAQLLADPAGLLDHRDETLALLGAAHRRTAADGRPDRRHQRADGQTLRSDRIGEAPDVVVARVDAGVRVGEEEVDAVELDAVDARRRRQIEQRRQADRRFRVAALADHARPHRIVQFRPIVALRHDRSLP